MDAILALARWRRSSLRACSSTSGGIWAFAIASASSATS
jgi:hypothetical protein